MFSALFHMHLFSNLGSVSLATLVTDCLARKETSFFSE